MTPLEDSFMNWNQLFKGNSKTLSLLAGSMLMGSLKPEYWQYFKITAKYPPPCLYIW